MNSTTRVKRMIREYVTNLSNNFYTNYFWVADWIVTGLCNLDCVYCDREQINREDIDYRASLEKIKRVKPKHLWITGNGEPTLVPDFADLVREAKESWDPFISLTNNGTNFRRLARALPYLDRVVISLDGVREVNKQTRGIDGDKVLDHVKKVHQEMKILGGKKQLGINAVITTQNFKHLESFVKAVDRISPEITVFFSPLLPVYSSNSILTQDVTFHSFKEIDQRLEKDFNAMNHFMQFENGIKTHVECYHQYFRVVIDYYGEVLPCKPQLPFNYYMAQLKGAIRTRQYLKARSTLYDMAQVLLLNKYHPLCFSPCNCHAYLDAFFHNVDDPQWTFYEESYKGRFTYKELQSAHKFIVKHVNSDFSFNKMHSFLRPEEKIKLNKQPLSFGSFPNKLKNKILS